MSCADSNHSLIWFLLQSFRSYVMCDETVFLNSPVGEICLSDFPQVQCSGVLVGLCVFSFID